MNRTLIGFVAGIATAAALGAVVLGVRGGHAEREHAAASVEHEHEHGHAHGEEQAAAEALRLTPAQIEASGIVLETAAAGDLVGAVGLPASAVLMPDRTAVVSAKAAGIVATVQTRLGATVARGEVLAVLDSREVAEARGELLAAQRAEALARATFERERALWQKKVSAEQDYLQARAAFDAAGVRIALARQRLATLGVEDAAPPEGALGRYAVRAPIAGRIVARNATVGAAAAADAALFTVADLSRLWFEAAAPPGDLALLMEGAPASVEGQDRPPLRGAVAFVGPTIDPDTRLARAIVEAENSGGAWRPGDFATVMVERTRESAPVLVPAAAIQRLKGTPVVFVRSDDGFEMREVVLGRSDSRRVEIRFGVDAGETVATANSFVLKAQVEKAEAEHSH